MACRPTLATKSPMPTSRARRLLTGRELMQKGLNISLKDKMGAAVLTYKRAGRK